jgi:histidinol-phosphate aminotransferase
MRPLVAPYLNDLVPYVPGKPIEETEREYGVTGIAKLASNENCLGPSPRALDAIRAALAEAHLYPDAGGHYLKERLARLHARHGVQPADLVLGNGTNELITLLARAVLAEGEALLNAWPSFVCYRIAARGVGRSEITVPLRADLGYDLEQLAEAARRERAAKLVFLANPNNPTGRAFAAADLDAFMAKVPADLVVVLDEAYAEYVTDAAYPDGVAWVKRRPRTVVLRTFSKVYGLASLRIGYAVCDPEIADVLNRLRDAFNTGTIAQRAALAALDDVEHVSRSRAHNAAELPRLSRGLEARGFSVVPSQGNFVLARLGASLPPVPELNVELLKRGVIVRPVANYGITEAVRISVGTVEEDDKLLGALDDLRAARRGPLPDTGARAPAPGAPPVGSLVGPGVGSRVGSLVVALDGPAGAGKSTVAKLVAQRAGLSLVDTGAIYRSVALEALRRKVSVHDGEALAALAAELAVKLRFEMVDGQNLVRLAGAGGAEEDISQAIRTPEVSAAASSVSLHPPVRAALLELQRALGRRAPGAVLEGRDIGTVVFPEAKVKAFVTASPEERARRRMKELSDKGLAEPYDKVLAEIVARDKQDTERAAAPLKPAADATLVDTTGKSLDEVVGEILALIAAAR